MTKLFTSAAALAQLGPNFSYQTKVVVPASVASGQTGPIYLVGGGDPWLEANGGTELDALASQVAQQVKSATAVIGVSSAFAPPIYGIGWPKGDLPQNYAAGTSALMAERNEIFVKVAQGAVPGEAPTVTLQFNSDLTDPGYFHVVNQATTGAVGSSDTLSVTRSLGTNNIVVTGSIPASAHDASPNVDGPWVLSVGNPALFTASLFQQALVNDGVQFSGAPSLASSAPSGSVTLATHQSPSLAHYLPIQNQYSINQMAENLYRALGMNASGVGSLSASAQAMAQFSQQAGVPADRVQVDGSGLSPLDEMSAEQMVDMLTYSSSQSWFSTFRNSLMQVNNPNSCGILCGWNYQIPANSDIWVKTGNLSNQWNYAGYAQAPNGDLIAFAVLDDGTPTYDNAYPGSAVDTMMSDVAWWPNVPQPSGAGSTTPASAPAALPPAAAPFLRWMKGQDNGTTVGISVVNVVNGQTVYQQNGETMMRAGLLPRLVLGDAALAHVSSALPSPLVETTGTVTGGTLNGALVLNGNHDSQLTGHDLQTLARQVAQAGIKTVNGPLEYVNSVTGFHASRWPSGTPWNDMGLGWTPPSSNLMVNQDQATLSVSAASPGQPATVRVMPADTPIAIQNNTTSNPGQPSDLHVTVQFHTDTYVLSGNVAPGKAQTVSIAPPNPGDYAATEFVDALKTAGVTVTGAVQPVSADPGGTQVASLNGPTLSNVVLNMLQNTSIAPAESLEAALGSHLWPDIGGVVGSSPNYIVEPTGAAMGNYLTPDGVSQMLASAYGSANEAPLVHALSQAPWVTQSPEEDAVAAYVPGPDGAVYAVTVMVSGVLWNHHFTPQILTH